MGKEKNCKDCGIMKKITSFFIGTYCVDLKFCPTCGKEIKRPRVL